MNSSNITITAIKERLIAARDERRTVVENALNQGNTLCVLKTNTPSYPKNTQISVFLLRLFACLINKTLAPNSVEYHPNDGGDFYLFDIPLKASILKERCMRLEEEHPLGRLIDLDVFDIKGIQSRRDYNRPLRRCFLCDNPAQQCARFQAHSVDALNAKSAEKVKEYLSEYLSTAVCDALRKELFIEPKFGLVTHADAGIHNDMNSGHFLSSIRALKPFFKAFIAAGFNETIDIGYLRTLGLEAEKAMYQATDNINTHKGAIFLFGILLPYLTKGLVSNQSLIEIITNVKTDLKDVLESDLQTIAKKNPLTSGEKVFITYGLRGIRGEVLDGFPSLMTWFPKPNWNDYQKLCAIMAKLDDTTIIKRKNLQTLKRVKQDMQALMEQDVFRIDHYKTLSNTYKLEGISPGGSADMLALAFLIERVYPLLKKEG